MKGPTKTRLVQMLDRAIEKSGMSQRQFAEANGWTQQTLSTWLGGTKPSRQFYPKLRAALQINVDQLDELLAEIDERRGKVSPDTGVFTAPGAATKVVPNAKLGNDITIPRDNSVPVYGQAVGGDLGEYEFNGQALDYVMRPPALVGARNAYAVFIDGESMAPRYRPGETVWVNPARPPRRHDDVVVQLSRMDESGDPPYGYVKEFLGWTPTKLRLRQYNPDREIEFERDEVLSVHTVVFADRT